jgi:hypothetical protein
MTGKHYKWQKRWVVDADTCTATHDSGFLVVFKKAADGGWDGEPIILDRWQDLMSQKMNPFDLMKHTSRLLREAGEVYMHEMGKKH